MRIHVRPTNAIRRRVYDSLEEGDVARARWHLSHVGGRDTEGLNQDEQPGKVCSK